MLEELLAAIKELTATLQAMSAAAPAAEGGDAEPEETPATTKKTRGKKAAAAPAEDEVTLEDVRAALKVLVDAGNNDTVKKLLKKHGGAKLGDIDASKYAALKADAEEAAGGNDDDLL